MNAITTYTGPADALDAINRAELQPSTKLKYRRALAGYFRTGGSLADADSLARYAETLPTSGRAFLKSAVKLWGDRIALEAKASATPDNVAAVQATVYRLEALQQAIQVEAPKGQKAHTWLSQAEVKRLLDTCDISTIRGQRDRLLVGLLVGAGLRREELAGLEFEHIILQPLKGKMRTVLNIRGKGAKDRPIPISDRLAAGLDTWAAIAAPGRVARSINKAGQVGGSLSPVAIFQLVRLAGAAIGRPGLAPHDLRRTYAELGRLAGVDIVQISLLLGHSSVVTTQKYLNLSTNADSTISDFIPF